MADVGPLLGPNPVSSEYLEAYRGLRAAVMVMQRDASVHTLVVTSATPGEGKTTVAVNLATVLALAEKDTLLVDADFRRPQIHALYGIQQAPGFTDACKGKVSLHEAVVRGNVSHLSLLPVGGEPDEGADIMGSVRMHQLLAEMKERFDFVVFDSAPVASFAGAVQLGAVADAALLVVRSRTYAAPVQRALRALEAVGATVPGIVLNDVMAVDREVLPTYYYGYGKEAGERS
jgi:capsular exopolysaccharide synthesis family protein